MRVRRRSTIHTLAGVLLLALLAWLSGRLGDAAIELGGEPPRAGEATSIGTAEGSGTERVARAFADRESGFMVTVEGSVAKLLSDDRDGSRHQRFLVELPGGQTLLVAHNIDLAERVPLSRGDRVRLRGQYEWNERGGVLHWTHRDPDARPRRGSSRDTSSGHEGGWIEIDGRRIE